MPSLANLRPPALAPNGELDWVLRAAFASQTDRPAADLDQALIERYVAELGVAERLASRPAAALLTSAGRERLHRTLIRSTATCLMYEGTARLIADLAANRGLPVTFLKGFAFHILRIRPSGSRPFGDLDVLARPSDAQVLFAAALEHGFSAHPGPPTEQHLPILLDPRHGTLEIHFELRGLRRADGRAMTYDDWAERQALVELPELPGRCAAPERSALAAHLLVHGLQQHLLRPGTYPLLRMVGDLIDLLPNEAAWDRMLDHWGEAMTTAVTADLISALRDLCARLAAGGDLMIDSHSPSGVLLRHIVVGSLDADYVASLSSAYLSHRLADARRHGKLFSYLQRKFFGSSTNGLPARARVAALLAALRRQVRGLVARLRLSGRSSGR